MADKTEAKKTAEEKPKPKRRVFGRPATAGVKRTPVSGGVQRFITFVTLAGAAGLVVLHPRGFSAITDGAGKILTTIVKGR